MSLKGGGCDENNKKMCVDKQLELYVRRKKEGKKKIVYSGVFFSFGGRFLPF